MLDLRSSDVEDVSCLFAIYKLEMNVLFLGDIVGQPGRECLKSLLSSVVIQEDISYVVVNGENSAGGSGITPGVADEIFSYGVDAITMGDHLWKQKDVIHLLNNEKRFFRPFNYPDGTVGQGAGIIKKQGLPSLGVINAQGRTFMSPLENPFNLIDGVIESLKEQTSVVLVDFHAEATSEKIAMGWYLDGRVSLIVGTHTHVQTSDDRVLPGGTGYITDVGFCGGHDGVIGREKAPVINGFKTLSPSRFPVSSGDNTMHGVIAEIDVQSGHCISIKRLSRKVENQK